MLTSRKGRHGRAEICKVHPLLRELGRFERAALNFCPVENRFSRGNLSLRNVRVRWVSVSTMTPFHAVRILWILE